MADFNPLNDPTGTPDDVATLYSWANLHGAKYRDFSAARAQTREKYRLRAEQAVEGQSQPSRSEVEGMLAAEEERLKPAHTDEGSTPAGLAAAHAASEEFAGRRAAHEAAEIAARRAAEDATHFEARQAAMLARRQSEEEAAQEALRLHGRAPRFAAHEAAVAARAARQETQHPAWHQPAQRPEQTYPLPAPPHRPQPGHDMPPYMPAHSFRPAPGQEPFLPRREEIPPLPPLFSAPEPREPAARPAWLGAEPEEWTERQAPHGLFSHPSSPSPSSPPHMPPSLPPEDTLQGSRDRLTSRWFALRGVFDAATPVAEAVPGPVVSRTPAMAVFSLAGGVGKTSLVATLGRALAARGERVLLVDTAAFGLLPFFFGATDQRPGLLRTFSPPGISTDAPVQLVTIDPEGAVAENCGGEGLSGEIYKFARGASRVIVDLATASGATTRRILRMSPLVLVPVIPDMNSVVSVSSIDAFFEHNANPTGKPSLPFYLLNQFDATLPLHLDVREVLREQLGDRLLPFALRRTPAMSEALAEGMTVMDYAPGSPLAEDFATLAAWVKSLSSPATTSYRGVRWSER